MAGKALDKFFGYDYNPHNRIKIKGGEMN